MIPRIILLLTGVLALFVGAFYIVAPEAAVQPFALGEINLAARVFVRAAGAAVAAIGVLNLMSIGDTGSRALRAVFVANIVTHLLTLVADFGESYDKSALQWVTVVLHLLIPAAFGYLLITWNRWAKPQTGAGRPHRPNP